MNNELRGLNVVSFYFYFFVLWLYKRAHMSCHRQQLSRTDAICPHGGVSPLICFTYVRPSVVGLMYYEMLSSPKFFGNVCTRSCIREAEKNIFRFLTQFTSEIKTEQKNLALLNFHLQKIDTLAAFQRLSDHVLCRDI